jgi:hypothetical protein
MTNPNQGTEVTTPNASVPAPYTKDDFDAASGSGDYLRRLQVMTGNSDLVKQEKMQLGTFALISQGEGEQLGKEVDLLLCAWRNKAMDINPDIPVIVYNRHHELWDDIKNRSFGQNSGCMYGNEFLCYMPEVNEYVTFYCGSKTLRNEAPKIVRFLPDGGVGACTLFVKLINPTNSPHSWHSAAVKECVTEISISDDDHFRKVVESFYNVPDVTGLTEEVEEEDDQNR